MLLCLQIRKKISLYIILLIVLFANSSCVRKVAEYRYEDIVVTRYEHWKLYGSYYSYSEYRCNKTNPECKIIATGNQNYYSSMLVINKETNKVWIVMGDAYIEQHHVNTIDVLYYQMVGYTRESDGEANEVKNTALRMWRNGEQILPDKYELYYLYGTFSYLNEEKKKNLEMLPNSKIKAVYY